MKIIYDDQVDALYLKFIDKKIKVTTQRLTEDISINYGPKGEVVGLEVLSAHDHVSFSGNRPKLEALNLKLV